MTSNECMYTEYNVLRYVYFMYESTLNQIVTRHKLGIKTDFTKEGLSSPSIKLYDKKIRVFFKVV